MSLYIKCSLFKTVHDATNQQENWSFLATPVCKQKEKTAFFIIQLFVVILYVIIAITKKSSVILAQNVLKIKENMARELCVNVKSSITRKT